MESRGLVALDERLPAETLTIDKITDDRYKEFVGEGQSFYHMKRLNLNILNVEGQTVTADKKIYVVDIRHKSSNLEDEMVNRKHMRNITYIFTGCLFVIFGMGLISCNEQDYKLFDSSRTGIYFTEDSVVYSFGVTKLEVTSYEMKLPMKIMGAPVKEVRSFKVEVVQPRPRRCMCTLYLASRIVIERIPCMVCYR